MRGQNILKKYVTSFMVPSCLRRSSSTRLASRKAAATSLPNIPRRCAWKFKKIYFQIEAIRCFHKQIRLFPTGHKNCENSKFFRNCRFWGDIFYGRPLALRFFCISPLIPLFTWMTTAALLFFRNKIRSFQVIKLSWIFIVATRISTNFLRCLWPFQVFWIFVAA